MRVAVIGGGASGMMAAGFCAKNGHNVDLFEANEKLGKKIYITGKGRCNVTNASTQNEIMNNIINNAKFLYSSLNTFDSYSTINFFEENGVPIKIERGNRAFPVSDKSSDIIKALSNFLVKNKVNVYLNSKVVDIGKNDDKFCITTSKGKYCNYDATICCVGGATYSATGSKGDGYLFAKKFGHTIKEIKPGLVPILLNDKYIKQIEGLSLKNVKLVATKQDKIFKELFGEMLFTSLGISGPIVLSMSSYINREQNIKLYLDLKPALTNEQLLNRIERDINTNNMLQIATLLSGLLPKSLVEPFLNKCNIEKTLKVKSLNIKQKQIIAHYLKHFDLDFKELDKLDYGIITSGGINVKEIDPKTMESKIVPGLYFAGEVLDVDALTGGFNLQIAFTTGYVAGNSII